jgi:hypothetical protein
MGKHAETGSLFYAALSLDGTSSHFSPRTTRPQDKRRVRCLLTDSSVGRDRQGVTWLVAISRRRRVLDQAGVIRKHVAGDGSGGVFITRVLVVDSERNAGPGRHVVECDLVPVRRNWLQSYACEAPPTRVDMRGSHTSDASLRRGRKIRSSRRRAEKYDSDHSDR